MATWYLQTRNQRASAGRGKAHALYIAGDGLYADKDEVVFVKDYNLPPWAKDGADFFDNADKHERANGRSYRSIVIAIPVEATDTISWAEQTAQEIVGNHAYRLAVHNKDNNPHLHIQLTERASSQTLSPEKYFGRGNPKDRAMNSRTWLDKIKEIYEQNILRIVPLFCRPVTNGLLKVGPQLKRAGKTYEANRQERIKQNLKIKELEAEQRAIANELQRQARAEAISLLDAIRPQAKQEQKEQMPKVEVTPRPTEKINPPSHKRSIKIR